LFQPTHLSTAFYHNWTWNNKLHSLINYN
jgi:hypothetical protein